MYRCTSRHRTAPPRRSCRYGVPVNQPAANQSRSLNANWRRRKIEESRKTTMKKTEAAATEVAVVHTVCGVYSCNGRTNVVVDAELDCR